MRPTSAQLSKWFWLSDRLSILMEITEKKEVTCEWKVSGSESITSLTPQEEDSYKKARREMFSHLATILGKPVDIYELHSDGKLILGDAIESAQK